MTSAADLILKNAKVHSLAPPKDSPYGDGPGDEISEAVAVRGGRIIRVGDIYEIDFLSGVDTTVIDCEGRVLLPGFVDAHTHLESTGQYLVHADLSDAASIEEAIEVLQKEMGEETSGWIQGFGWDETDWSGERYLRSTDLDRVSSDFPVVAFRVDMHVAALNTVAIEQTASMLPEDDIEFSEGTPTGIIVEDAVDVIRDTLGRDKSETKTLVKAAKSRAQELGITAVHEKVRNSHAPRIYRDLAVSGDLGLRVRIDYWSTHLDALEEVGLRTNAGGPLVQTGAIKSFTDGSFGARTAKITEPYADVDPNQREDDGRGQWVVEPAELRKLVRRADEQDFQLSVHAIGDEAISETVNAVGEITNHRGARHRIEHVELHDDTDLERMAEFDIVASCQPNFLQWTDEDGLYEQRLGRQRTDRSNRYRDLLAGGIPVAFGSDSMPLGPLEGVHYTVNASTDSQRLSVTEALRAYTLGGAFAGFDEARMGSIERNKVADLTMLERSPWANPEAIRDIDIAMTIVNGEVVYDRTGLATGID